MAETDIARAERLTRHLPEVSREDWYATPGLKVAGKGFARMKEGMDHVMVVMCPLELKDALIEAEPDLYFETAHYRGWPAMLVHLDAIDDARLTDRLECAWAAKAPKKLLKAFDAG